MADSSRQVGARLVTLARRAAGKARRLLPAAAARCLPRRLRAALWDLAVCGHAEEDNSEVTLYCGPQNPFPGYPRVASLEGPVREAVRVSLVATARNERTAVERWLTSLSAQARPPDEVVLVDGGSTDGTLELLRDYAARASFPVRVLAAGDVNIAEGRNLGIAQAAHSVIANTDLGCRLDPHWLESLVRPFELAPETEVSAGWYEAESESAWGRAVAIELVRSLEEIDPQSFLPSARSLAFRWEAWQAAGGYPEWLTRTAEDSYFALELKRCARRWAFVPGAIVHWQVPARLQEAMRKNGAWLAGDGEAALFSRRHRSARLRFLAGVALPVAGVVALLLTPWVSGLGLMGAGALAVTALGVLRLAHKRRLWRRSRGQWDIVACWPVVLYAVQGAGELGFLHGVRHRGVTVSRRLRAARGLVLILSGVPLDDSGGGQRASQLALEFLRRGYAVTFVHRFPRQESVDLDLCFAHPNLFSYPLDCFDAAAFLKEHRAALVGKELLALVEFPLREFLPPAGALAAEGGTVIYDLIDDWTTALGAPWYTPQAELAVAAASHALMATAEPLRQRLAERTGRPVALVPNAVNAKLFARGQAYPRPADLPRGEFVIAYIGKLWGEWMDWPLLRRVAEAYPRAVVVIIGDYRGQCPDPPANLHFLGLKAQRELPAYLAHTDVAIIPWAVNQLTRATNPLKVYEYLAMGRPVVAPRLGTLEGVPYVLLGDDADDFVANVQRARNMGLDAATLDAFVEKNSWCQRVDALLEVLDNHPDTRLEITSNVTWMQGSGLP